MDRQQLSGVQKVALLMAEIGEEAATKVMSCLDEEEQERIGQALVELDEDALTRETVEGVLSEFQGLLRGGSHLQSGFGRTLQGLLTRTHGAEEAERRLERIKEQARSKHPFRGLRGLRAKDLARVLGEEHPQVQALVLTKLDPDQSAEVLECYTEEDQADLVMRMATLEEPSPRLLRQVAQQTLEKTRGLMRQDDKQAVDDDPRLRVVADLLNAASAGVDRGILEKIQESDEEMVTQIRERMFAWQDLVKVDKRTMQKILAGIDTKLLAMALKGCSEEVEEALLGATSQRTRDMILEERELLGSVPLAEVVESQKQILATVRELIEAGEIKVSTGKGAQFVS